MDDGLRKHYYALLLSITLGLTVDQALGKMVIRAKYFHKKGEQR